MSKRGRKILGFEMPASAKTVKIGASPNLEPLPIRAVRRLVRERSGLAAVEFAVLLPMFAFLIFMISQVGLYFYFSTTLYYVTDAATRQILTGGVANQGFTAAQYRTQILCPLLPRSMSCNNVVTNIQVVPPYSGGGLSRCPR
jgi:Flp pilus assembly protein TadG